MLRLRPSELTLTPEDVDETFRRMARKQANKSSRHASSLPPAHSARPVLRRGPQRAVRDAITALGDIPILRPQPHQVVYSSVEEDIEYTEYPRTGPRERVDSVSDSTTPSRDAETSPANTSTISALRNLHLPFRLRRGHVDVPVSPPHPNEGTNASPERNPDRIVEVPTSPEVRRDPMEDNTPTRPITTPSPAGLRGGGSSRRHKHTSSGDASSVQSSSRQRPSRGSSHDQESRQHRLNSGSTGNVASETLYLEGFFKNPLKHPRGPDYWFREILPQAPQTEPRRGSGRQTLPTRSLSFSSALTQHLPTRKPTSSGSCSDDVFRSAASREYPSQSGNTPSGSHIQERHSFAAAPRQFSSESSTASGAFSLYELPPESRKTSNEQFGYSQRSYSQYDGAVASSHPSRGAYRSVHSSQLRSFGSSSNQPPTIPGTSGQHGVSPLPSMPYTRNPNIHINNQVPQSAYSSTTPSGEHMDAATAAIQDLPSPLGPYSEHYENILHNTRHTMPAQASPYQNPIGNSGSHQHSVRVRRNTPDVQARNVNDLTPYQSTLPLQHPTVPPAIALSYAPQATRRSVQGTRADQRSSENVPVRPSAQRSGPSLNSQVQIHRSNFERLHNAMQRGSVEALDISRQAPSRHSLPQSTVSHDTSNRPRTQARHPPAASRDQIRRRTSHLSSNPLPPPDNAPPARSEPSTRYDATRTSPIVPPTAPPRNNSRFRSIDPSTRPPRSSVRNVTPAIPPPTQLHPTRNLPSTALVLDHVSAMPSLRSPLVRATTSARPPPRRVPPQQRDQENSGAGEEQLMREEEAAIQARYGEREQRETMDETPPRVGRVERRMLGAEERRS